MPVSSNERRPDMIQLPARPTRRPRARQALPRVGIEERLITATITLLSRGEKFASLSIEQLATEAGFKRQTFYTCYKDKGELVARLIEMLTAEILRSAQGWPTSVAGEHHGEIEAGLKGVVDTLKKHRVILAAINETAAYDAATGSLYRGMMQTICGRCRQAVASARASHLARPGADDAVADALGWFVMLHVGRFNASGDEAELERLCAAVTHVCTSAIFK